MLTTNSSSVSVTRDRRRQRQPPKRSISTPTSTVCSVPTCTDLTLTPASASTSHCCCSLSWSLRAHAENAWVIGTIGNVMKPILVNTKLGNVPKEGAHGYDAIRMQPNHPEQFFFRS